LVAGFCLMLWQVSAFLLEFKVRMRAMELVPKGHPLLLILIT